MFFKNKLFGNNIEPACEYCEKGSAVGKGQMILCSHKGVVAPYFHCRKFTYTPLKRVPAKPTPPLPEYSPDDFKL